MAASKNDPNFSKSSTDDCQAHNTEVIPTLNMTYDEQILSLEHNLFEEVVENEATSGNDQSVKVDEVLNTNSPSQILTEVRLSGDNVAPEENSSNKDNADSEIQQVQTEADPSMDKKGFEQNSCLKKSNEQALEGFDPASDEILNRTSKRYADMAMLAFKDKKYSAAVGFYTMALDVKTSADYLAKRGECYLMQALVDQAQVDVDRSLQLEPSLAYGYYIKGRIEQSNDRNEQADKSFIEAINLNPKDKHFVTAKTDNRLSRLRALGCNEEMAKIYASFESTLTEAIDFYVDSELERQEQKRNVALVDSEVEELSQLNTLDDMPNVDDQSTFSVEVTDSSNTNPEVSFNPRGRKILAGVFGDAEGLADDERKRASKWQDPSKRARRFSERRPTKEDRRAQTPSRDNARLYSQPRSSSSGNFSTVSRYSTASRSYKIRKHLPENVIRYQGVFVENLSLNLDDDKVQSKFEIFGAVTRCEYFKGKSCAIAYVDFDNPESPRYAIQRYNGSTDDQLCFGRRSPLILRFIPSKHPEQPDPMEFGDGFKHWKSRECYYWRRTGCDTSIRKCTFEHHEISRGIDFQEWMNDAISY